MNVISDRDYKESGMYAKEQAEVQTVPIQCKVALTIKEARSIPISGLTSWSVSSGRRDVLLSYM